MNILKKLQKKKAEPKVKKFKVPKVELKKSDKIKEIKNYFSKNNVDLPKYNNNNSYEDLMKNFCKMKLNDEVKRTNENENKNENNINNVKSKKIYNINGKNITNEVEIIEDSIKSNIPYRIKYQNYIYIIEGKNPENQMRITWYCQNYRKVKNKPIDQKKFCSATIQGLRKNKNDFKEINFYEKNKHSNICLETKTFEINKNKEYNNNKEKLDNENTKDTNNITENRLEEINNKKEFYEYLENYLNKNKNIIITCSEFIKFAKKIYYKSELNNTFIVEESNFKNIYYKVKRNFKFFNLEDIYEYSKSINNGEFFCRNISLKMIISNDKKIIEHKCLIFFTDFDIKRLASSEHLLIDGTFIYPIGFMQTVIIMYFDVIIEKMIPGIFIVLNNKTEEGYYDCFNYIKDYLYKLGKKYHSVLKIKTYTTDFEIGLYKAFDKVFNPENKIKHIGCYFHFLQNIRKYLQKNGLTKKKI